MVSQVADVKQVEDTKGKYTPRRSLKVKYPLLKEGQLTNIIRHVNYIAGDKTMQLDHTRLYGFKTLHKEEWAQLVKPSLATSLGARLGSKLGSEVGGIKAPSPALGDFVDHRLGSRVGLKSV
jgi:hypothetical protein